ncbi:hypothetical protein EI555_015366, partial [Monodon monoceros]
MELWSTRIYLPQSQEDEVHLRSNHYKTNGSLIACLGPSMISTQKIEMVLHTPDDGAPGANKMADGELNVDSLITRLLEVLHQPLKASLWRNVPQLACTVTCAPGHLQQQALVSWPFIRGRLCQALTTIPKQGEKATVKCAA